jgi:general secretion pathway protein F
MPIYKYEAVDKQTKKYQQLITASSLEDAKRLLRQQGVMVVSIELRSSLNLKISLDLVATFFHQLATLLSAGFPLYEAVVALQEQYENEPIHELFLDLADQIQAGQSLAQAIQSYPEIFDSSLVAMIRAGEKGASLSTVLERCSQVLASQVRIKKQLITTMIYPIFLAIASFSILLLMLLFVVPSLEPLFDQQAPSSILTAIVFSLSLWLRSLSWGSLLISLMIGYGLVTSLKKYYISGLMQENLIKLPLIGRIIVHSRLARFSFIMQALLEAGVVLVDALEIVAPIFGKGTMYKELLAARENVLLGKPLSVALNKVSMPTLLIRMIRLGENSGDLASCMKNLKELMDEELQKDLTRLTAAAQPAILIIMGTFVGLIMAAILIPLTDMGRLQGL